MLNVSLAAALNSDPDPDPDPDESSDKGSGSRVLSRSGLPGADPLPEDLDDTYLFPEERVLVLLEEHDGRMWQGEVVAETGFSKAKVSKLLTAMEDDGDVVRHWEGGKKVVTLPEVDPEADE